MNKEFENLLLLIMSDDEGFQNIGFSQLKKYDNELMTKYGFCCKYFKRICKFNPKDSRQEIFIYLTRDLSNISYESLCGFWYYFLRDIRKVNYIPFEDQVIFKIPHKILWSLHHNNFDFKDYENEKIVGVQGFLHSFNFLKKKLTPPLISFNGFCVAYMQGFYCAHTQKTLGHQSIEYNVLVVMVEKNLDCTDDNMQGIKHQRDLIKKHWEFIKYIYNEDKKKSSQI